jgi:hypothetical protein
MADAALRQTVLDLGLEDDIPLWEVAETCRRDRLVAEGSSGIQELGDLLLSLAREGKIRILAGRWDDPSPRVLDADEAAPLLADGRRYVAAEEIAVGLDRVYYVNVDNISE